MGLRSVARGGARGGPRDVLNGTLERCTDARPRGGHRRAARQSFASARVERRTIDPDVSASTSSTVPMDNTVWVRNGRNVPRRVHDGNGWR